MTQGLPQWIAEVQTLQQQLAALRQRCNQAEDSATNWCQLYESEAQQRRLDAAAYQQQLETLQAKIGQLEQPEDDGPAAPEQIAQTVAQIQSVDILQARLVDALTLCERLSTALKAEQANHAQTRDGLMTALGDAVDLLTKRAAATEAETVGRPVNQASDRAG